MPNPHCRGYHLCIEVAAQLKTGHKTTHASHYRIGRSNDRMSAAFRSCRPTDARTTGALQGRGVPAKDTHGSKVRHARPS